MSLFNAVNSDQFHELVKEDVVLVDFWAPWCGPCKMLSPVLDKLAEENVKVVKVNVDDLGELAGQYEVMSVPTLLLFKDGNVVDKTVGAQQLPQLKSFIEKNS